MSQQPVHKKVTVLKSAASTAIDWFDQDDLPRKPIVRPASYVGPQACVSCHAERVSEFKTTRHFLACVLPQPDKMPSGFEPGKGTYQTRDPSLRFEMSRQGETFVQTAVRTTADGEQRSTAPIGLMYGYRAGSDEVYFNWHDNRLYELPMVWLHQQNQWGTSSFDAYGSGDFSRPLAPRCLECHTTWVGHVPGSENQYQKEDLILGVTCEVCHGPGKDHVVFHQSHPENTTGQDILHPGHLDRQRQLDLCAQCHSNAIKHRGHTYGYRPGDSLDAHYKTLQTQHPEDDHVANQTGYLLQSKCFQKSDLLTCTTCHNPHRPRDVFVSGSASCRKCHQPEDCPEQSRVPEAVRDQCSQCHMPAFNKVQVHFRMESEPYFPPVKRWEHRIAVYPTARDEVLWQWHRTQNEEHSHREVIRLRKTLSEHWLKEAEKLRGDYRFIAAIDAYRQALRFDPAPATQEKLDALIAIKTQLDDDFSLALNRLPDHAEAIRLFNRILAIKPDLPQAHGRLGTLLSMQGQQELAIEHWRKVSFYDPNDAYGEAMLGWNAYLQARYEEAITALRRADDIEPFNAKINLNLGLALASAGQISEAIEQFKKVVDIEPQNLDGYHNLSLALRNQMKPTEAIPFAVRATKLAKNQNPELLMILAEIYAEAGRPSDAIFAAEKAVGLARSSKSNALGQLRKRQEKLHERSKRVSP
ncbi:MAG: tetratricopeptide repeat protein [Planctomycetia bacterium]|nr:tetratricopeptide repeat protein [Planctomycetia bacterium]